MDNGLLSSPFGVLLSQLYIIQGNMGLFLPSPLFSSHNYYHHSPLSNITSVSTMSASVVNNVALNAAATPFDFTPSFETDAPYLVEQHLYDSPANIAHDNQVAVDFLTVHNAPVEFWEQAGYEDPRLSGPRVAPAHPGAVLLLDRMEREREDRIAKLEKRVDLMYVIMNSLNEDFSHFALEHWGPFQASLFRYFGHQCHGSYCTDPPAKSPVVPSPPPGSGRSSPSLPSLESCPSSPDGGEVPEEEDPQESDDSFWSTLSSLRQVTASTDEVEGGSGGSPRPVWVRISERGLDGRKARDA
jgi:hypothetical protein